MLERVLYRLVLGFEPNRPVMLNGGVMVLFLVEFRMWRRIFVVEFNSGEFSPFDELEN